MVEKQLFVMAQLDPTGYAIVGGVSAREENVNTHDDECLNNNNNSRRSSS